MELNESQYRAAMQANQYQAQIMCPKCSNWMLTKNLQVYKVEAGEDANGSPVYEKRGEAGNYNDDEPVLICEQTGCGEELGHVTLLKWPYSAPVKWRRDG